MLASDKDGLAIVSSSLSLWMDREIIQKNFQSRRTSSAKLLHVPLSRKMTSRQDGKVFPDIQHARFHTFEIFS